MTNRCVIIEQPGIVRISEVDVPKPSKNEALLKVLYSGICGSDLGSYRGTMPYTSYPRVPGHEFSAEIIEIEENTYGLKKGMVVTANPYFNCEKCYSCRRSMVNCCTSNQTMGVQREGAFYQYIVMPMQRIYDGKGLSPKAIALIEPFCIGWHGIQRAKPKPGEKVLIIGAGPIGILTALAALRLGTQVSICDIIPRRLDYANELGIKNTFLYEEPKQLNKIVNELTQHDGFDIAVEAAGLPITFQNCIDSVAFGGRVVLIGISSRDLDFQFSVIQKKELNIFGSRNALKVDFTRLLDIVKKEEINLEKMISKVYSFNHAEEAFADLDKNMSNHLKMLLYFS